MIAQFQIETADGLLHADMLSNIELPNELTVQDFTDGIVFSGKGPVWLYSLLTHLAHPFAWVGVHDPRLGGAVVVQKHSSNGPELGTVVHFDL
jgi:CRISPR-associated protein Csx3